MIKKLFSLRKVPKGKLVCRIFVSDDAKSYATIWSDNTVIYECFIHDEKTQDTFINMLEKIGQQAIIHLMIDSHNNVFSLRHFSSRVRGGYLESAIDSELSSLEETKDLCGYLRLNSLNKDLQDFLLIACNINKKQQEFIERIDKTDGLIVDMRIGCIEITKLIKYSSKNIIMSRKKYLFKLFALFKKNKIPSEVDNTKGSNVQIDILVCEGFMSLYRIAIMRDGLFLMGRMISLEGAIDDENARYMIESELTGTITYALRISQLTSAAIKVFFYAREEMREALTSCQLSVQEIIFNNIEFYAKNFHYPEKTKFILENACAKFLFTGKAIFPMSTKKQKLLRFLYITRPIAIVSVSICTVIVIAIYMLSSIRLIANAEKLAEIEKDFALLEEEKKSISQNYEITRSDAKVVNKILVIKANLEKDSVYLIDYYHPLVKWKKDNLTVKFLSFGFSFTSNDNYSINGSVFLSSIPQMYSPIRHAYDTFQETSERYYGNDHSGSCQKTWDAEKIPISNVGLDGAINVSFNFSGRCIKNYISLEHKKSGLQG